MRKYWLITVLMLLSFAALSAPKVMFNTNMGPFIIELNQEKAPVTVANFLKYVKDGSYEGAIFHRVISNFMIQGGGFDQQMSRLPTYPPIINEADNGLMNHAGTIAMARTRDPNSATRQFYINLSDNNFLNYNEQPPGYAVFGKVVSGFSIIQSMAKTPTVNRDFMRDVPETPIVITKVSLIPDHE